MATVRLSLGSCWPRAWSRQPLKCMLQRRQHFLSVYNSSANHVLSFLSSYYVPEPVLGRWGQWEGKEFIGALSLVEVSVQLQDFTTGCDASSKGS